MSEHPEKVSADQRDSMSTDCKDLQCSQGYSSTNCITSLNLLDCKTYSVTYQYMYSLARM